ncbi:hypothetical protein GW17_00061519, partial [Ensete ventricosum]
TSYFHSASAPNVTRRQTITYSARITVWLAGERRENLSLDAQQEQESSIEIHELHYANGKKALKQCARKQVTVEEEVKRIVSFFSEVRSRDQSTLSKKRVLLSAI